jgi:signal peptidase I
MQPAKERDRFSAAPGEVTSHRFGKGSDGKGSDSALGFLKELPILIVVAFAIALIIKTFVVQAFYIPSGSMENTLLINDRVLVSKFIYDFQDPKPGNIVVFVAPAAALAGQPPAPGGFKGFINSLKESLGLPSQQKDFIKRVVAVGGDTVQIKNHTLYVNNVARNEPYLHDRNPQSMWDFGPVTVGQGQLFVMGDNRGDSSDSRVFGPIPKSSVLGEAFLRIWPPGRFRVL